MIDKIKALLQEVENMKAANAEELEALRIKYCLLYTSDAADD